MVVIPDFKDNTITRFLIQNVAPGSTLYTDGLKTFTGLDEIGLKHVPRHLAPEIPIAQGHQIGRSSGRPSHW